MTREYKVKDEALVPYYPKAVKLANKFEEFCIDHMPRHKNTTVDV